MNQAPSGLGPTGFNPSLVVSVVQWLDCLLGYRVRWIALHLAKTPWYKPPFTTLLEAKLDHSGLSLERACI